MLVICVVKFDNRKDTDIASSELVRARKREERNKGEVSASGKGWLEFGYGWNESFDGVKMLVV